MFECEEFKRYREEALLRFAHTGNATVSAVRECFNKIPNCGPSDEEFSAAMKKAHAQPFTDRVFNRNSLIDHDTIIRIAEALDEQVRTRRKAAADKIDAERIRRYELEDAALRRKAEFEEAQRNTIEVLKKQLAGDE